MRWGGTAWIDQRLPESVRTAAAPADPPVGSGRILEGQPALDWLLNNGYLRQKDPIAKQDQADREKSGYNLTAVFWSWWEQPWSGVDDQCELQLICGQFKVNQRICQTVDLTNNIMIVVREASEPYAWVVPEKTEKSTNTSNPPAAAVSALPPDLPSITEQRATGQQPAVDPDATQPIKAAEACMPAHHQSVYTGDCAKTETATPDDRVRQETPSPVVQKSYCEKCGHRIFPQSRYCMDCGISVHKHKSRAETG